MRAAPRRVLAACSWMGGWRDRYAMSMCVIARCRCSMQQPEGRETGHCASGQTLGNQGIPHTTYHSVVALHHPHTRLCEQRSAELTACLGSSNIRLPALDCMRKVLGGIRRYRCMAVEIRCVTSSPYPFCSFNALPLPA